ncbi:hypothetical protein K2P47_02555 [Patescibacteria group bacterium]|nr:hypothetical protein [Patescibacteria group bacterium]
MLVKILFISLAAVSLVTLVWFLVIRGTGDIVGNSSPQPNNERPLISNDSWQGEISRAPGTIASMSEASVSDTPVVQNEETKELSEDFFQLTGNTNLYDVSYDSQSGIFTITLYGSDTKTSRVAAEDYILDTLPYTKEQWCDFVVNVFTNVYENPTWAGPNLGLSFCPGSIQM